MTKMGRPKKEIDFKELEKLCALQCSEQEICDWFDITPKTLQKRVKEFSGETFSQFFRHKRTSGKIALRRNMLKMSEKHPSMAIFLAKNWLGMRDVTEMVGEGGGPIQTEVVVIDSEAKKLTHQIMKGKGTG
jgi:hypothetical protein